MTNPVKAFQAALAAAHSHQKRATGDAQHIVGLVEDEFSRIAKVNEALQVIHDQQILSLDDAVYQATDALDAYEATWKLWGVGQERSSVSWSSRGAREFEATLSLSVGGSGRGKLFGVYRLDTPTVWGSHMGEHLVGPAERDPKKLLPVLKAYGITRLSWDRQ